MCRSQNLCSVNGLGTEHSKAGQGLQPPRGGYGGVSLMRIFTVQWAVFEERYQLGRLQAGTGEARKPDRQVACMMLRVTSFLHIAFHFRSSLKTSTFLSGNIHSGSAAGPAAVDRQPAWQNTVYSQTGEDRPCLEMDCLISGIIKLITHIS